MKKGVCPRCQSKEVYGGTKVSPKAGWNSSNAIPISGLKTAALDNYVCGSCGYVESYIAKEKDLGVIRKKWPLVF
jgi:predicted nucleic-acid-binding Zn-ribbon protein